MNLSLWILVLGAVGASYYFGRRKWQKKSVSNQRDKAKRKKAAEEAEIDRLACLDLGKSLMSSVPGSRAEAGSTSPDAGKNSG
jgi:hypothetical protein